VGKSINDGHPWSKELIDVHKSLLDKFDDAKSRSLNAATIERVLNTVISFGSSMPPLTISFVGISYIFSVLKGMAGHERRREGEMIRYLWKELKQLGLRISVAIAGGLAIITPMLIMSFNPSQTKNFVTTSVCVFFFAVFLGLSPRQSNTELLAGRLHTLLY
jgi:hypothetical protein